MLNIEDVLTGMLVYSGFPLSTQQLIRDIADGDITPFLGAGTSIASSNNHPCASWVGLIWDALQHCQRQELLSSDEHQAIKNDLSAKPLDTDKLINCAERLSKILGYEYGERFQKWIGAAISSLPTAQTGLLANIAKLSPVNVTTNYDLLIESVSNSRPIDLHDIEEARAALLGRHPTTLHIHGHIENIQNIVFSSKSYDNHIDNARHDFVQKSFSFIRNFLFIGCGNGLEDPNVGPWMKWDNDMFGSLQSRHYRLVLKNEIESAIESNSRIINIAYGEKHADLGPFIGQLVEMADSITEPSSRYAIHRQVGASSSDDVADVIPLEEFESQSLERLGDNAARKNDYVTAIDYYEQSLELDRDLVVEMKICQAEIELCETSEASRVISKLLTFKKNNGPQLSIQLNLLSAYSKIDDYESMILVSKEILNKEPKLAFAWDGLLMGYQGLNRYVDILKDRKVPLLLFPFNASINERVGLAFFQTGRCLEALNSYEIVLEEKPDNKTALLGKLRTLTHLGGKYFEGSRELSKEAYLDQALALSDLLKTIDGQNPEVWIQLSIVQKEKGNFADSKRSLQQAKLYGAETASALKLEATLMIRKKRYPAAIGLLSRSISEYPNNPQLPYTLAIARIQKFKDSKKHEMPQKEFNRIEQHFNSAIELDSENVFFLEQIIGFYELFNLTEKAFIFRERLSRLNQILDVLQD